MYRWHGTVRSMQKRALWVLFFTLLIDMVGFGMIFPVIPSIFTDAQSPAFMMTGYSIGAQYFYAGLVAALFGIMQFFAAPLLGELSDTYGRKRLLTIGVAVLAAAQLLFGLAVTIGSLSLLLFSRVVAGLAGANFSIAQASIADVSKPEDRAKNFGLIGAAFGIGFILGPLLGGWISETTGVVSAPFWVAGLIGLVNVVFISLFLPETRKDRIKHDFHLLKGIRNIKEAFDDKDARPVYLSSFFYNAGFSFFTAFVGVLLVEKFRFSEGDIGTFFAVIGAWVAVTQIVIVRFLASRYGERSLVRFALPVLGIAILLYPFVPSVMLLYATVPVVAIANGLIFANIAALISKSVSNEKQGAALGINGSLMALAGGIAPLLAGIGSGFLGISTAFIIGMFLIFCGWFSLFGFKFR